MEEKNLCINCDVQTINHKKRKLCDSCYHKIRRANGLLPLPVRQRNPHHHNLLNSEIAIQQLSLSGEEGNKAEILFAQSNPKMFYQPTLFYLPSCRYTPDFYDPKGNRFIEIIGSRQRYHQLLPKLAEFKRIFPKIKIDLLCGDGKPYYSTKEKGKSVCEAI